MVRLEEHLNVEHSTNVQMLRIDFIEDNASKNSAKRMNLLIPVIAKGEEANERNALDRLKKRKTRKYRAQVCY